MLQAFSVIVKGEPTNSTVAVHHWSSAACCNKSCQLAAVSTAVSGEQQGCTFTSAILSPVLLPPLHPSTPTTFVLTESHNVSSTCYKKKKQKKKQQMPLLWWVTEDNMDMR